MSLKLYNSLTGRKEEFKPIKEDKVKIYSCGQTIYDDMHIGNARTYSAWDVLNRYLTHKGYKVFHVMNITDVGHLTSDADWGEDKVEKAARERKLEPMELVTKQVRKWYTEMDLLNMKKHNVNPRATGHIVQMIEAIKKIIANGYAYEKNGSVYFDLVIFCRDHEYPKIGPMNIKGLRGGAGGRVSSEEMGEKKSPLDFALWIKASPGHIMKWASPWSIGYPGWHLECSVMHNEYMGEKFDIHTGGVDHLFPHHPNERAQDIAMHDLDVEPVNFWLHSEYLTTKGTRMSTSEGDFLPVMEFVEEHGGEALRMLYASSHYRKQIDFNDKTLANAKSNLDKLYNTLWEIENAEGGAKENLLHEVEKVKLNFEKAMDDDLNTPLALNEILKFCKTINKNLDNKKEILKEASNLIQVCGRILGLKLQLENKLSSKSEELLEVLVNIREDLRDKGYYKSSDKIRTKLRKLGIQLEDRKNKTISIKLGRHS